MYGQYLCATAKWVKFWKAANEASVVGVEAAGAELAVKSSLRALSRSHQEFQEKFVTIMICVSMVSISVGILKAL
jgi:hypothetical protein